VALFPFLSTFPVFLHFSVFLLRGLCDLFSCSSCIQNLDVPSSVFVLFLAIYPGSPILLDIIPYTLGYTFTCFKLWGFLDDDGQVQVCIPRMGIPAMR
jgi:hypothetical protein